MMVALTDDVYSVKECPACGTYNPATNFICSRPGCGYDLGNVPIQALPTDKKDAQSSHSAPRQSAAPHASVKKDAPPSANQRASERPVDLNETVIERKKSLTFVSSRSSNAVFQAADGAILGREHTGGNEIFDAIDTVSRVHARVSLVGAGWEIEDLSANGTYINGAPMAKGERRSIKSGDLVQFSSCCEMKVIES
jgi:hypothetical protein